MKDLRLQAARQLFFSIVTSGSDNASQLWSFAISDKVRASLDRAQRVGAQAILGIFPSVALSIAEAEVSIEFALLRHQTQLARFWISLHNLPKNHALWRTQKRPKPYRRLCSPMAREIVELNLDTLDNIEEIQRY